MAETATINAQTREVRGTGKARGLRRGGWLPGVVSTPGGESVSIQMNCHDFERILVKHGRDNLLADIKIDEKKPKKVLLKEVQYDPVHGGMLHADFIEISMTKKMRLAIPIVPAGEAVGVSQQEGVLQHMLRELDVECMPADLVENIAVNIEKMNIGDTIFVRDLIVGPKLKVLTSGDVAVVSVVKPQAIEEEAPPAEEVAGEPEVIGEKKEGEEEEGAEAEAGTEDKRKDGKTDDKHKDGKPDDKRREAKPEDKRREANPKRAGSEK